jgi:YfiH family protein
MTEKIIKSKKVIENQWISLSSEFSNPNISAFFSNKNFSNTKNNSRSEFANLTGFKGSLIIPKQIHSNKLFFAKTKGIINDCDGAFSDAENLICSIQVADCMPIFFANKFNNVFGLIHAGWRGLVNNIILESKKLIINNNYCPSDFEILIGPSIQKCCFEVQSDVVKKFGKKFVSKKNNGGFLVDLQSNAQSELQNCGFKKNNIHIIPECTFCNPDKYLSYRKNKVYKGRMYGLIGVI